MKHFPFFCLMVLCLATLPASFAQISPAPVSAENNSDAAIIMDQYFLALANGDSATIETLLGGRLLKKRKRLLDNPAYSGHLKKIYQDAGFKVLNYHNSSPGSVTVDVLITFGEGETLRKSYQLERTEMNNQQSRLVIVSETAIAETL